jgi:beta-phosphoglucomutase-like phosphatase (HAD superfamily)
MIKAIFWDNDGVLVDTERRYFLATQQVLATTGIPLTKEQYIELFLVQGKGAWHLAADGSARLMLGVMRQAGSGFQLQTTEIRCKVCVTAFAINSALLIITVSFTILIGVV